MPMALARIFSRHPEHTSGLAQQLEQQGYTVEVLSPEAAPLSPADLEIQLEVCDPADVLRRAAELAACLHADIAVAPGTLRAAQPAAELSQSPKHEAILPADLPASPAAPVEPAVVPPTTMEAAPPAHAVQEREKESVGVFGSIFSRTAHATGGALAACTAAAGELLLSARDRFRESRELSRVRAAESRAFREQRLLELTRRRAEAQEHALELEAGRKAVAAYLLQLEREYPGASADARHRPPFRQGASPVAAPPDGGWQTKTRRIQARKWEAVLAGLVSASALFVIGLAVASYHSRPALSANRGVTLHGAQTKPAAPARPTPVLRKATRKAAKSAPVTRPQHRTPQRVHELVARDVVVRHFPAPATRPQNAQQDGVKHYSDMEN